jgi:tRNA(fMet)-specific endonuclease VapC
MGLILDTNFIIAAEREARRGAKGPADAFLAAHAGEMVLINFTIAGELACGQSAARRRDWESLCRPYPIIPWSPEIAWEYGEIYRHLSSSGQLIGTNDLWIAATARQTGHTLVTNNLAEFQRVPGLDVLAF